MPRKIFTVQDEPPTWDDNDDPGMESVSDASSGGRDKDVDRDGDTISRSDSHDTVPLPSPIPIPIPEREELLQDEYTNDSTNMNENAIEIANDSRRLEAMKIPAMQQAEKDMEGTTTKTTTTTIPRPPKPRPLQSMGPVGPDSWIRPVTGGEAAPNGRSVL